MVITNTECKDSESNWKAFDNIFPFYIGRLKNGRNSDQKPTKPKKVQALPLLSDKDSIIDSLLDPNRFQSECIINYIPIKPTEGRYEKIGDLGKGGWGKVWLCKVLKPIEKHDFATLFRDSLLHDNDPNDQATLRYKRDRQVALKLQRIVPDMKDFNEELPEVEFILSMPYHSNLLKIHDIYISRNCRRLNIAMEVMEGTVSNLLQSLRKPDLLNMEIISSILFQIGCALKHLHTNGWVHRDVKPENILLACSNYYYTPEYLATHPETPKFVVKLSDYGLCKRRDKPIHSSGTIWYTAPELLAKMKSDSGHAIGIALPSLDIWGLGCLAIELLIKKALFPGRDDNEQRQLIDAALEDMEGFINATCGDKCDVQYKELVMGCLKMNKKERLNIDQFLNLPFFNKIQRSNKDPSVVSRFNTLSICEIMQSIDFRSIGHNLRRHTGDLLSDASSSTALSSEFDEDSDSDSSSASSEDMDIEFMDVEQISSEEEEEDDHDNASSNYKFEGSGRLVSDSDDCYSGTGGEEEESSESSYEFDDAPARQYEDVSSNKHEEVSGNEYESDPVIDNEDEIESGEDYEIESADEYEGQSTDEYRNIPNSDGSIDISVIVISSDEEGY